MQEVATSQHMSKGPPRYTEAQLVKTLQQLGIGRPSTYAPVISVLQVAVRNSFLLSACLPACYLSVCQSVCLPAYLPACLSVCLSGVLAI